MEQRKEKLFLSPTEFPHLSDTEAIQAAVKEAEKLEVRVVAIPAKDDCSAWKLDAPILVPSYFTVILDGCSVETNGIAFMNANAKCAASRNLGGEQHKIFILGRHGAQIVSKGTEPQILIANARDCRIAGLSFVGGAGVMLDYFQYSKIQNLRFSGSKHAVYFGTGCNNIILESLEAETVEEAIIAQGGDEKVLGRYPDICESILCRIQVKTQGAPAVGLYAGNNPMRCIVVRDVTDATETGVSVCIGKAGETGEIRDMTVRGVDTTRASVETKVLCDGMFYANLRGTPALTTAVTNTRELLDDSTMEIELPQFPEDVDRPFLTPNDPEFFGATDSETIQNAVDAASIRGINCVVIPRWNVRAQKAQWDIEKVILVPNYMTIVFLHSYLRQADFCYENMFANSLAYKFKDRCMADEQHDMSFIGVGDAVLDGGTPNGLLEKTCFLYGFPDKRYNATLLFNNVRNLVLDNFQMRQSRWYCTYFIHCDTVRCSNLDFDNWEDCCNRDGVDVRQGCHNFLIENITGTTGDDTVALNNLGNDGNDGRAVAGKDPDAMNIIVRNVKSDAGRWFTVRLLDQDRHLQQNVVLDTIMDVSKSENKKRPGAAVMIGSHEYHYKIPGQLGDMAHFKIRDIYSRSTRGIAFGGCNDDFEVSNVHAYDDCPIAVAVIAQATTRNIRINGVFYKRNKRHLTFVGTADCDGSVTADTASAPKAGDTFQTSSITSGNIKVGATVLDLPNLKTDGFTVENLFVDFATTGIKLSGNSTVEVKNLNIDNLTGKLHVCDAKSTLIIDGEVVSQPTSQN